MKYFFAIFVLLTFCLSGCESQPRTKAASPETQELVTRFENELAMELFDRAFGDLLAMNPQRQTRYGIHENDDKWTGVSFEHAARRVEIMEQHWDTIRNSVDFDKLNAQNQLSYELFGYRTKMARRRLDFWWHKYPVNQMFGAQAGLPAFLINIHPARNITDLENYIARLRGMERLFDELVSILEAQEARGIMPPRFVYDHAVGDCRNILTGAPFDPSDGDSPLLADFRAKVKSLRLVQSESDRLIAAAGSALSDHVGPAYRRLLAYLTSARDRANGNHGVWNLPEGGEFYRFQLKDYTTMDMGPDEIHQLGLSEVARIQREMRTIMDKVGFEGDLKEFFDFMRTDDQFFPEDNESGRQAYLDMATSYIARMRDALSKMVDTLPEVDLIVKAVEPYRETSAGKAFYDRPSPDGNRPGIFYVNLHNAGSLPLYELEALAYHEAIPGHHLQVAIAQRLEDLPRFRRFGSATAYSEGWGLYAEYFPKEYGFYEDPYSDFGRLTMELRRAVRLVLDTGIHHMKWSREKAIDYFIDNTPYRRSEAVRAVERYMVLPGQATAYKTGMIKILELRYVSETTLGDSFDLAEFHDVILRNGPLPLSFVERAVDAWLDAKTNNTGDER